MLPKHVTMILPIKSFIDHQRLQRHCSPNTCIAYAADLDDFHKYLTTLEPFTARQCTLEEFATLSLRDFRGWLVYRQQRGLSASATARAISSLRVFNRYCQHQGMMFNPHIAELKAPKRPQRLPRPLEPDNSRRVLSWCLKQKPEWIGKRDVAVFALLWGCGLRISEALSLRKQDIAPPCEQISIIGKGNRQRQLPVLPIVQQALYDYHQALPYSIASDEPLFRQARGGVLKPRDIQKKMQILRRELGLPDTITPHAMRHSFASDLLKAGGDLRTIQELLGHQSLASTQHYTQIDRANLARIYHQHHRTIAPARSGKSSNEAV